MKKIFLLLSIIIPFLYSCSSDESFTHEEPKMTREVTIHIKGVEEFSSNLRYTSINNSNVEVLYYSLFREEEELETVANQIEKVRFFKGKIFKKGEFDNVIKENLKEGYYRITLLATTVDTDKITVNPPNLIPPYEYFKALYTECGFWSNTTTSDYFFKDIEFEVKGNSINESVTLDRLTGKVEIIPLDVAQAPLNLKKIEFIVATKAPGKLNLTQRFYYYKQNASFQEDTPMDSELERSSPLVSKSYTREDLLKINEKNPISLFLLEQTDNLNNHPIYARFEYQDGTFEYSIIKSDYEIVKNQIVKLRGDLFKIKNIEINDIDIEDEWETMVDGAFD